MTATIAKWGNSLGIRIPSIIAKQVWLTVGRDVIFDIQNGDIILHPIAQNKNINDIENLIAQITQENKHEAVFLGALVGKENVIW
jgi:antitoxin MazE